MDFWKIAVMAAVMTSAQFLRTAVVMPSGLHAFAGFKSFKSFVNFSFRIDVDVWNLWIGVT